MLILDTTSKSLELVLGGAVTTNELQWTADYVDINQSTTAIVAITNTNGLTNGTTPVTIAAAPGAGISRQGKFISVFNNDTVSATVIIQEHDGANLRIILPILLASKYTLYYETGRGFYVLDANGLIQNGQITSNILLDGVFHTDTLHGNVVAGDIIYGNSTPKWQRLPRATNDGRPLLGDSTGNPPFWGPQATFDNGNSGTTKTIDWSKGIVQKLALNNNCTLTFTNPVDGDRMILEITQSGGGFNITWPASVLWPSGSPPVITTTNGKLDLTVFVFEGGAAKYYGSFNQNY